MPDLALIRATVYAQDTFGDQAFVATSVIPVRYLRKGIGKFGASSEPGKGDLAYSRPELDSYISPLLFLLLTRWCTYAGPRHKILMRVYICMHFNHHRTMYRLPQHPAAQCARRALPPVVAVRPHRHQHTAEQHV